VQEWLNLVWVHDGLVPFFAGLVAAELFNRLRLSGLAILAGVSATVYLAGRGVFSLAPANAYERVTTLAMAATAAGLILDLVPRLRRWVAAAMALAAAGLTIWTTWPAVTLQTWISVLVPAGLGMVYAVWTAGTLTLLADAPERAGAVGVGLGGSIGACALSMASAPLASLAFAAAAASGAYLLIQILSNERLACGTTFALPLAAVCALVPPALALTGGLAWYLLPALALVPAAALIPLSERLQTRVRAMLALAIALAAGAAVIALTWSASGSPVK
jgi:hypothetical protein